MSDKLQTLISKLDRVKHTGGTQYMARCPAHDDKNPSLSIGLGDDGRILLHCQSNKCSTLAIVGKLGMRIGDLFPPKAGSTSSTSAKLIASYTYTDAEGVALYEVCRYTPKAFKQRKVNSDGSYSWSMDGVPRVLYHLADIAAASVDSIVLVVEGEKDADNLAALRFVATCNSGGAGKWSKLADDSALHGRHVVIIPDNDQPGRDHAEDVKQHLAGRAASVRFLVLPDAKDASAWIEQGGTAEHLCSLIDAAGDDLPPTLRVPTLPPPTLPGGQSETVDPDDYRSLALKFVADHFAHPEHPRLVMLEKVGFYEFTGKAWRSIDEDSINKRIFNFLAEQRVRDDDTNDAKPLKPWMKLQAEVLNALRATVNSATRLPAWLGPSNGLPDPSELIVAQNGIFHVDRTGNFSKVSDPTPRLFCASSLDYPLDLNAPDPVEFLTLSNTMLSDIQEQVDQLQEWIGLNMVADLSHQKMMLVIGPPRCGKGLVLEALHAVVGGDSATGTNFAAITSNFGMSSFIGKLTATIGDARFSGKIDQGTLAERLLSLSGGDAQFVDVKYKDPVSIKCPVRLTICSNYLPNFSEQSGALARRFLILDAGKKYGSFQDKEDHEYKHRILAEVKQIGAWGVRGLMRLRARGRFKLTAATIEQGKLLKALTSPVQNFLSAMCVVESGAEVTQKDLYQAFRDFQIGEGVKDTLISSNTLFGIHLKACIPNLEQARPWIGGERVRVYRGVRVRTNDDDRAEAASSAEPTPDAHEFFDDPPKRRAA